MDIHVKFVRMFLYAAVYLTTCFLLVSIMFFGREGWFGSLNLAFQAAGYSLFMFPQALAFWMPLAFIELAELIWRPRSLSLRRDGLLALLLVATALPSVLFLLTTYYAYEYAIYNNRLVGFTAPVILACGLCVPIFFVSLILIARGRLFAREASGKEGRNVA